MNRASILSAEDPALADYRAMRDPVRLRQSRVFLVEGREAIRSFLGAPGFTMRSLLATESALEALRPALDSAAPRIGSATILLVTTPEVLRTTTGFRFHQGCLAAGDLDAPAAARAAADVVHEAPRRSPGAPILFLEDVTDPDNVGSVLRNALAFGAGGVVLTGGCAHPLYRKSIRTSLGAVFRVPFAHGGTLEGPLRAASDAGYDRVALAPRGSGDARAAKPLDAYLLRRTAPPAWIVGNEGLGLSNGTLEAADRTVRIEMTPDADSINVAAATAVALHGSRAPSATRG